MQRWTRTAIACTGGMAFAGGLAALGSGEDALARTSGKRPRPELVELGRRLFMDPTVSRLGKFSCASCHDPEHGFSDRATRSADDDGPTKRHSQPLTDLGGEGFHWDGEFETVRQLLVARIAPADDANEQAAKLLASRRMHAAAAGASTTDLPRTRSVPGTRQPRVEGGYGSVTTPAHFPITPVAERLAEDGRYAEAFQAAFRTANPTTDRVLDAIDAYCASLETATNAYDRMAAGDDAALSPSATRGMFLFEGKAGCVQCHSMGREGGRAPFTDGKFHDTGVAFHEDALHRAGIEVQTPPDLGRAGISFRPDDLARFKTPSLRDVALRAPYMHDGSFPTLDSVVRYYDQGGTRNANLDPAIRPLGLSDAEVADVVAFLESLTGEKRAGLGFPSAKPRRLEVRVLGLGGEPVADLPIHVAPFGDRLVGEETVAPRTRYLTDERGVAVIDRPLWTHVLLTSPQHELGLSRPIPDTAASQTLLATPRRTISLRVRRLPNAPELPRTIAVAPSFEPGAARVNAPLFGLTRTRRLGANEALYVADAQPGGGVVRCTLRLDDSAVLADIDLDGGASETIVLGKD